MEQADTGNDSRKYVYSFDEGDGKDKKTLGGKGSNLCEMTQVGFPVPPGFVVSTVACNAYDVEQDKLPDGLMDEIKEHVAKLEEKTGKNKVCK